MADGTGSGMLWETQGGSDRLELGAIGSGRVLDPSGARELWPQRPLRRQRRL